MGAHDRPSATLTFLFTDVEDHTRLWERHPEEMPNCLERHDEIVRGAIERRGGYVFSTGGDGFGAAFPSVEVAAAAAVDAQQGLTAHPWPEGCELRVRMGLHTGEAQERDGDYFGPAVIRAARLMSIGHGGQVLLSNASAGLLAQRSDHDAMLRVAGEVALRGLDGTERVSELRYPGLEVEFPPLAAGRPTMGNLPVVADELIGRNEVLATADELLGHVSLLTLVGPGGVGKTRLSIEIGATVADRFGDSVWFVPLASVTDEANVPNAVAEVLGVQETAGRSLTASIVGAIAGRELLLILDNCEHVIDGARRLAEAIVRDGSGVVVMATSREPLLIGGERVVTVVPLPVGSSGSVGVAPAVELFVARANAADPSFGSQPEIEEPVREICAGLDGMPLAIELAAARVRGLGVEGLASHLDDRFRLLRRRGAPDDRHRTLRATVGWSFDLLDEHLRELFCRAGVFAGGFTLDTAEEVLAFGDLDELDVADGVAELVDKSMLQPVGSSSDRRYRMLETMRQFGSEAIEPTVLGETRRRFVRHYARWCRETELALWGREVSRAMTDLSIEFDNIREAVRLAIANGDVVEAACIAISMHDYGVRGVNGEPQVWATDLVDRVPQQHHLYGDLLAHAVWGYRSRGDRRRADRLLTRFDDLDANGDVEFSPRAVHCIAESRWFLRHTQRSVDLHRRAIADARAAGDWALEAYCLSTLSMVQDSFDRPAAEQSARASIAIGREMSSPMSICSGLLALAGVVVHAEPERAIGTLDELIDVARDAGLLWFEAAGVRVQAHAQSRAGRAAEASRTFTEALDLNGVGDFGELLWYTVLNIVEHLTRIDRASGAAIAFGALTAAPAAPSDDLVARALVRMRQRIEVQLDDDIAELEAAGAAMRLAELIRFLQRELDEHSSAASAA